MVQETNAATGETTEREMTFAEIAARKTVMDEMAQAISDGEAKVAQKAALLTKLGITAEEAALLLK